MNHRLRSGSILRGCAILLFVIPTAPAAGHALRDEAETYRAQGYEAQQRGDRQEAMAFYQKAVALDPSYPVPHNDVGTVLEDEGRLEEAERAYEQALSITPHCLEAHANLALLYERMGQQPEKALYHWLKRYELGAPEEAGTQRAKERLLAAGIFHALPDVKPEPQAAPVKPEPQAAPRMAEAAPDAPPQPDIFNEILESHTKSLEEFHGVTNKQREWSR